MYQIHKIKDKYLIINYLDTAQKMNYTAAKF